MFFPGGGDLLVVRTVDIASGPCIAVDFERSGGIGYFDDTVELPVNWSIMGIWLYPLRPRDRGAPDQRSNSPSSHPSGPPPSPAIPATAFRSSLGPFRR
jgi:hypothetical protein